ncbi:hypothetical protein ACFL9T_14845, partial [Thermodesulfobacteriota bacterium]
NLSFMGMDRSEPRLSGSAFTVDGSGFMVQDSGCRIHGQDSGFTDTDTFHGHGSRFTVLGQHT